MADKKEKEVGPLIYGKMAAIMADVSPIAKDKVNKSQGGFKYRGIDDVYNMLCSIMAKHGVFHMPEVLADRTEDRESKAGGALIYRILTICYTFYAEDGSMVDATVIGEGMDSGDKASNKAMAVADKYCLLQAFCIPTDDINDPDAESHEVKPKQQRSNAKPSQQSDGEGPSWSSVDRYRWTCGSCEKKQGLDTGNVKDLEEYTIAIKKAQGKKKYATLDHLEACYAEIAKRENSRGGDPEHSHTDDGPPPHDDMDDPF